MTYDSIQEHTKYNITLQSGTCDDKDVIIDHSIVVSLSSCHELVSNTFVVGAALLLLLM